MDVYKLTFANKQCPYIPLVLTLPLLFLLLAAAFNYRMDPYQIHSEVETGDYGTKPAIYKNMRLHKAYQIQKIKPDALILGTSKAIQGYPITHKYFTSDKIYNAGLTLATTREMYHYLQHARAQTDIKKIVFTLDFIAFNSLSKTNAFAAGFQKGRMHTPEGGNKTYIPDYAATLLSFRALRAGVESLGAKKYSGHEVMNSLGGRSNDDILRKLHDGGHKENTLHIENFMLRNVLLPKPKQQYSFVSDGVSSFDWYRNILDIAYQSDIETVLIINPSHARLWEVLHHAGLWPKYKEWKTNLVAINESAAQKHGKASFPLWDFTTANKITTEPFPDKPAPNQTMQYYYEAVHFSQTTGALVLDRISGNTLSEDIPENFGVLLNSRTIKPTLKSIDLAQRQFRLSNSAESESIKLSVLNVLN